MTSFTGSLVAGPPLSFRLMRDFWFVALAVSLVPICSAPLAAQVRASEVGTVSQVIDGTKIVVEYSRPRSRGRDTLFGTKAVQWGEVWTPGANWATTLDVNRDITINKRPVPKGKYSVWFVVRQAGDWTLVLDTTVRLFHEMRPDTMQALLRIPVRAQTSGFTDVLTWSFPGIRMFGGTLQFAWERKQVSLDIDVQPSLVTTLPEAEAAPYLGRYSYIQMDDHGKPSDTLTLIVTHEDGTLKGQFDPQDPYFRKFALVRIAPDWFAPGVYDKDGMLYEVLKPDMTYEFKRSGARTTEFVIRLEDDWVFARGVRKP